MKKRFVFLFSIILVIVIISSVFVTALASSTNYDNNGDGEATVVDYRLLEKYLAGYDTNDLKNFQVSRCDYNEDGQVDLIDLNRLGIKVFEQYSPRY